MPRFRLLTAVNARCFAVRATGSRHLGADVGPAGYHPADLASASKLDTATGKNGTCGGSYLCTGKVGYDGPTGLGNPTV